MTPSSNAKTATQDVKEQEKSRKHNKKGTQKGSVSYKETQKNNSVKLVNRPKEKKKKRERGLTER